MSTKIIDLPLTPATLTDIPPAMVGELFEVYRAIHQLANAIQTASGSGNVTLNFSPAGDKITYVRAIDESTLEVVEAATTPAGNKLIATDSSGYINPELIPKSHRVEVVESQDDLTYLAFVENAKFAEVSPIDVYTGEIGLVATNIRGKIDSSLLETTNGVTIKFTVPYFIGDNYTYVVYFNGYTSHLLGYPIVGIVESYLDGVTTVVTQGILQLPTGLFSAGKLLAPGYPDYHQSLGYVQDDVLYFNPSPLLTKTESDLDYSDEPKTSVQLQDSALVYTDEVSGKWRLQSNFIPKGKTVNVRADTTLYKYDDVELKTGAVLHIQAGGTVKCRSF